VRQSDEDFRELGPFGRPCPGSGYRDQRSSLPPFSEDVLSLHGSRKAVHWSVPWSDLMMTLFILFAVLYAYQTANRHGFVETAHKVRVHLLHDNHDTTNGVQRLHLSTGISDIYEVAKGILRKGDLESIASVDLVSDRAVRITLTGDLLFDAGEATLKPQAKNALLEFGEVLRREPYLVNLVGHTDDVPIHSDRFPSNWELSSARAGAVARFLIEEMDLPPSKFYISGRAQYEPVRPNDGLENRAANRRVEILITKRMP
jgi:chemotaxis protein MotB